MDSARHVIGMGLSPKTRVQKRLITWRELSIIPYQELDLVTALPLRALSRALASVARARPHRQVAQPLHVPQRLAEGSLRTNTTYLHGARSCRRAEEEEEDEEEVQHRWSASCQ